MLFLRIRKKESRSLVSRLFVVHNVSLEGLDGGLVGRLRLAAVVDALLELRFLLGSVHYSDIKRVK
jgi:hypothetical protein